MLSTRMKHKIFNYLINMGSNNLNTQIILHFKSQKIKPNQHNTVVFMVKLKKKIKIVQYTKIFHQTLINNTIKI